VIWQISFTAAVVFFGISLFAWPYRSPFPNITNPADLIVGVSALAAILAAFVGVVSFIWWVA